MPVSRRTVAKTAAVGALAAALPGRKGRGAEPAGAAEAAKDGGPPPRCGMGIVEYAVLIHKKAWGQRKKGDLADPLAFLEFARGLGAGGIQTAIGRRDAEQLKKIRRFTDDNAMWIEANIPPPKEAGDVARFEADVLAAKAAGAAVARTVIIPGRRYEQFKALADFRDAEKRGEKALQLAVPVLAKHRFKLAVENHKDQRVEERLALLTRIGSEFVGACVDLGNSFTLIEDPLAVVTAFAPWAMTVHIKDQAAREYEDGFEYADAALGEGFLDLPAMVEVLQKSKRGLRFGLEVITRDALKVPVLTPGYWAPFEGVGGPDLARTLREVRARAAARPFPVISKLSAEEQVAAERANIERSFKYARERLVRLSGE